MYLRLSCRIVGGEQRMEVGLVASASGSMFSFTFSLSFDLVRTWNGKKGVELESVVLSLVLCL